MKMAFRRKDVKKAYYYVWFLGAKESKGLRGEQYILPALRQLVNIERRTEPCKVTIQISNKGIKIIQNVPKPLPNGQMTTSQHPSIENQLVNNQSSSTSTKPTTQHNATVKIEQIKHFIPHHAVTCALQSEDVVCIILLLYNPLTGCPVHVHGYRCDSIETAFTLRNQLQLLIDRPENQRKFAEIEARLAAKGLISQQQLLDNCNVQKNKQQIIKAIPDHQANKTSKIVNHQKIIQPDSTQSIYKQCNDSSNLKSKRSTLASDGRSAVEDECNQSEDYSPTIRSEPDGPSLNNKSLMAESKSSSGNSSGSSPPPQAPNPIIVEMYENLAAELKAKLGNSKTGPILLPPRDYDTVCRSKGKLIELDKRACTNKLVVGVVKTKSKNEKNLEVKKSDNLILEITKETNNQKKSNDNKDLKEKEQEIIDKKKVNQDAEINKIKKLSQDELNEQAQRLNYEQIREQQRQYEQKLKNLQRKQELYEQQQLLIEQQKQVRRELSQQHKPSKFVEELVNNKSNTKINKINYKEQTKIKIDEQNSLPTSKISSANLNSETSAVIHASGIKHIGSNLANKIKQSLIGSNKEKLKPQLICHKTIHDSLQSLNKLTKTELRTSNDNKFINKNLKLIDNLIKTNMNEKLVKSSNSTKSTTKSSNSSSNISRDLNEKLNTINSRSDSSNVSKSISSGIGSGANLNNKNNHDDQQYLSTDEELEDEILIHDLSECVDEYMPDYIYNQYLNENDEDVDEMIDDLDEDDSNGVIRRKMEIQEKIFMLEKNEKNKGTRNKTEFGSTGERVHTSSDDDGSNSICYDENLMLKINTAKRIKKQPIKKIDQLNKNVDNFKNAKNDVTINLSSNKSELTKNNKSVQQQSTNQVKRSEIYEMNSDQQKMFHNFYFPKTNKSPINNSFLHQQPKLFYFPNPDFKAVKQQLINNNPSLVKQQPLMKYHLGQQAIKCELRRQKSTPNVNGKINYHPMLVNNHNLMNCGSVEKLVSNDLKNFDKYVPTNLVNQRTRPISMVNIQPEHFRISNHQSDKFKRVPIFY